MDISTCHTSGEIQEYENFLNSRRDLKVSLLEKNENFSSMLEE